MARQGRDDVLFGVRADQRVDLLAVLEHDQGRDAHDAEPASGLDVLVRVELGERDLAVHLLRELLDDGVQSSAGAAPGRPEVDEDDAALLDGRVEGRIGEFYDLACHGRHVRWRGDSSPPALLNVGELTSERGASEIVLTWLEHQKSQSKSVLNDRHHARNPAFIRGGLGE